MKRFTFEMVVEDENFNMINSKIDELMSSAAYYARVFQFNMEEGEYLRNDLFHKICDKCRRWTVDNAKECEECPLNERRKLDDGRNKNADERA